ncbi:MAG: hypothetical protein JXA92_02090 [candidate division Zixibacteria bacterium]|nr:hypothetical protein [candidate division Zixibacteria bacterium]
MTFFCKIIGLLVPLLIVAGCGSVATRKGFYEPITAELRSGNVDSAAVLLETAREKKKYAQKDRLVYFLDAGLLYHYAGDYQLSNDKLHLAEAAAEELFTKSISRAALSMLLNDNVLEYAGEDHEILYANLISALNYIALGSFDDAFVEIRRANLKLDQLERKYAEAAEVLQRGNPDDTDRVEVEYKVDSVRFHNDAFARYLSLHLYAADGKYDDARIDMDFLRKAFAVQAHIYDFDLPEVKYQSESGAVLSVVGLAGLAPTKDALNLRLRTDKDLNLVQVFYDLPGTESTEYGHFPANISHDLYFKFAIPQLVPRPSVIGYIRVLADSRLVGELQLLEDVEKVATETFAAKKSLIYIRTAVRALAKALATTKMKKEADTGGLGGWLKKVAIDIGTDISENADLRSSQYLPGKIYVGDFEIAPGVYDITVEYYDLEGNLIDRINRSGFEVREGAFNLIETYSVK